MMITRKSGQKTTVDKHKMQINVNKFARNSFAKGIKIIFADLPEL